MKKVISFNIAQSKRDALLAFFKAVITASKGDENVKELCSIQLAALEAAFNEMQELAERHQMNLLTPEVQEADSWRDANLTRFRAGVRAELKNPAPEKRQAAELLWKICKEIGPIVNKPFDVQTGAMTTLCLDLQKNHSDDLTLLGLTDAFNAMKSSNEAFIKLLAERTEVDGTYEKGSSQKARAEATTAYRNFAMKLNTLVTEGHYDELATFIDYLNAEVERQRISLGQRPSEGGDEGDEGETAMKYATFHFINGNSVRLKVEVGATLQAPPILDGYMWKPQVPALMPARNVVFREVRIPEKEFTATFHFIDHTEKIVSKPAGSLLAAPENSPGCVWKPAVPMKMPAEDTAYYEVLGESLGDGGVGGIRPIG